MSAPHAERVAQPRNAEGDPQISDMLPGAFDDNTNTAPSELIQEEPAERIDFRLAGVGLNECERVLNECCWPVVLNGPLHARLSAHGIHGAGVNGRGAFDALQSSDVLFRPAAQFDFAHEVGAVFGLVSAIVIPVHDETGDIVDLAAWNPDDGALALWRGVACLLGEQNISAPRIEHDGVRVHPSALAWLRAGRTGVYVVDPERARWRLAGESHVVDDVAFGRRLRDALRLPEPQIFVTTADARRAA